MTFSEASSRRASNRQRMKEIWDEAKRQQRPLTDSESREVLALHQDNSELPEQGVIR